MRTNRFIRSKRGIRILSLCLLFTWLVPTGGAWGIVVVPPPDLNPLNQTVVPKPPQLFQFVKSEAAAIRLGKAFFWDMQAGSDGIVACATCHFSAGADSRLKNSLNPGTRAGDTVFGNSVVPGVPGFPQFGPNYTLNPATDFPFHQRLDPVDAQSSAVTRDTNDVVGSQGVRLSTFTEVVPGSAVDSVVSATLDPIFNAGGVNLRRVTARQAPTVINGVFNFTNFWDGRANFQFNGENPFGPADQNAGVWFEVAGVLVKRPVTIQFASLASQAVGPPLDTTEMSGQGRTFPDVGRKLLSLTPLGKQLVHPNDSVLGTLSKATLQPNGTVVDVKGLSTTYAAMIQAAFNDNLWNSTLPTSDGFTQMEANFSLFWGLAIQLYESTLVSDQSPFDNWLGGIDTAITDQQKFGFQLFNGIGNCTVCHAGIETTTASAANIAFVNNFDAGVMELMFVSDGSQAIYDEGFNNTAVRPTTEDIARGGTVPFTNTLTGQPFPLAFTSLSILQAQSLLPFPTPILDPFIPINIPDNKNGLFKVPTLRNVELTAPYFHNGSVMTLAEVMDVYTRGGNFPAANITDLDPIVGEGLSLMQGQEVMHQAVIAFLNSMTDERVRNSSAPFDHPELLIPEGDPEVLTRLAATGSTGTVAQSVLSIDAVTSPTTAAIQTVTGTVQAGLTPTVTIDTAATVGPVTVTGTGWSTQVSGLAFGPNTITATVVDAQSVQTTVTATITLVNSAPVANAQTATTSEDTPVAITLTATDANGDPLTYGIAAQPASGTLTGTPPNVTYTPAANFNGSDAFTFRANDGAADSNAATVTITVTAANDAVVSAADAYTATATVPLVVSAPGVLENDTDVDGNALTAVLVAGPTSPNATLTLNANGSFTYTYGVNIINSVTDTFTYRASDGVAPGNTVTVTITVNPNAAVPLTLITPNGGETVTEGVPFTISWVDSAGASFYKLQYSINGGATWRNITGAKKLPGTARTFAWTYPANRADSPDLANSMVRVQRLDARSKPVGTPDGSNAVFTIVR